MNKFKVGDVVRVCRITRPTQQDLPVGTVGVVSWALDYSGIVIAFYGNSAHHSFEELEKIGDT